MRRVREEVGLYQRELAERMGLTQSQIAEMEKGKRILTMDFFLTYIHGCGGIVKIKVLLPEKGQNAAESQTPE
jgi:transcriptional regulator with XRE-family HTH domain